MNNRRWKGVLWFLAITFGLTYAVEFGMIALGMRFDGSALSNYYAGLVVAGAMFFPAIGAVVTAKLIMKEDADRFGLRLGPIRPYLLWMVLMPILFAVIYGVTWLLGLAEPDFQMSGFLRLMVEEAGADLSTAPPPSALVAILFVASVITAPFVNLILTLGEEIGWRGYLLPRLLPLGRPAAYVLTGIIWALWHLPLILVGFAYPGYPIAGIFAFIVIVGAVNVIENELYLRNGRSTVIAAWVHGLFNAQKLGIWPLIFVGINPLLGGYTGLIGMVVLWATAILVIRVFAAKPRVSSALPGSPRPSYG